MKRISSCMVLFFAFVCVVDGVDLSIAQENGCLRVYATNNTFWYCRLEYSNTLESNDWHHFRTLFGDPDEPAAKSFSFLVKTNQPRTFWRIKDSPFP